MLTGVWLRVAAWHPDALGRLVFRNGVHAHSHLALFGWTTMALFALAAGATRGAPWMRWHAHAVGLASAAAWAGFLAAGYSAGTIVIATMHVALWVAFAVGIRARLARATPPRRRYLVAALALLVVAGAGAIAPAVVGATGIGGAWGARLSVELFLSPFIEGWLGLGLAGALYRRVKRPRFEMPVLWLLVGGAVPAALFRVAEPAPSAWLPLVGRAGVLAVGTAALLLALDVVGDRRSGALARLAGGALLGKGVIDIGLALAASPALMANQQLKIAYLHLVLLGAVTSGLLASLAPAGSATFRRAALAHAVGLAIHLTALATLGIPSAAQTASSAGLTVSARLAMALLGGVVSAGAILTIVARLLASPRVGRDTARLAPSLAVQRRPAGRSHV